MSSPVSSNDGSRRIAASDNGLDVTTFRDSAAPTGRHAYRLRIAPVDGAYNSATRVSTPARSAW